MNNICLVGNLTKDVEMKYTPSGIAITKFTIAVKRRFAKENQQDVDFIPIKTLSKLAEVCGEYLSKGKKVSIVGSLQITTSEKDGEKKWYTEVLADQMTMLTPKGSE